MTKLEQAARALLAHWDTPAWKYLKPTGDLMADLRDALDHSGEANEMVAEQAEQEPVAWAYEYGTDRGDAVNEIRWYPNLTALHKPKPEEGKLIRNVRPLYAAPVRTKDLTDDEIEALAEQFVGQQSSALCRAVIQEFRRKTK